MRVLVIGGTGFIGRHLVARLVAAGHAVYVPTRLYQRGRDLLVFPSAHLLEANIHDDTALEQLLAESDAVINLVGILHSRRGQPYGADFAHVHVELPRRIAAACRKVGVKRLLHVSALGASASGPSQYQRSKAAGEAALIQEFQSYAGAAYTIFRPSVVFGPEDNFMNMFARLARWLPVVPLAGAKARLQPIYVGDVADVIAGALNNPQTYGRIYPLAGLTVYTLGELVSLAARWSGHPRRVLPLPMAIGRLQALFFESLPGEPIMSRDNLDSLKVDNLSPEPMAPELGVIPTPLESVAPRYLRGAGA
ncbi:MAG TPA: complex I NDUFA9 subunit family protein [Eoetvoesiella sp.]